MDSKKDWRPDLGRTVVRMEKSSGKTPPAGPKEKLRVVRLSETEEPLQDVPIKHCLRQIGQEAANRPILSVKWYIYHLCLTREELCGGGTDLDLVGDSES